MKHLIPLSLVLALAACSATSESTAESSSKPGAAPREARGASSPGFRPIAGGDVLYTWSGGLDALFADPKDAGVREALRHLEARLDELPAELGDAGIPGQELALAAALFLGPGSFSIGPAADPESGFPMRAQLEFRAPSAEEARRRADQLTRVLARHEVPSLGIDEALGLSRLDLGMFEVLHGVATAGRADTLVVALNGLESGARDHGTLDLPAGAVPALAFRLDYREMQTLLETFGGPEVAQMFESLGVGDCVFQGAIGHGPDRCHAALRTIGHVPMARRQGLLAEGTLERAALTRVPKDATMAFLARTNPSGLAQSLRQTAELDEQGEFGGVDPLFLVRELTGIDLEADLLDHLGQTVGAYASDATGGGGHASWVAFVEVLDEPALRDALARLEGRLEDLAAEQGLPGLAVRRSKHGRAEISTLAVLGWPIPLEPSWALEDGWMYVGVTVQGVRAALDQARGARTSLLDSEAFRASAPGSVDGNVSISYLDVARFARDGYPLAAMFGSLLSNGLASAGDPDRVGPGLVPGFADFVRGARATVAFGRIEGQDLVIRVQADRSILVQAAGLSAAVGPLPLLLATLAAASEEETAVDESFPLEGFEGMDDADLSDMEGHEQLDVDLGDSDAMPAVPIEEPK